jgi:hypothetical protein
MIPAFLLSMLDYAGSQELHRPVPCRSQCDSKRQRETFWKAIVGIVQNAVDEYHRKSSMILRLKRGSPKNIRQVPLPVFHKNFSRQPSPGLRTSGFLFS